MGIGKKIGGAGKVAGKVGRAAGRQVDAARAGARAKDPNARSWDKLSSRRSDQTLEYRDVYEEQQLDRGEREKILTNTWGKVWATVAGILVFFLTWVLYSMLAAMFVGLSSGGMFSGGGSSATGSGPQSYYVERTQSGEGGRVVPCFRPLDADGDVIVKAGCYDTVEEVPVPDWWTEQQGQQPSPAEDEVSSEDESGSVEGASLGEQLTSVSAMKLLLTLGPGLITALILGTWASRRVASANLMRTTSDINQYKNDQHIALPEEIQRGYDWFPDVGAHSSVEPAALLSHMMLSKKGLPNVPVTQRAEKDVFDEDDDIVYHAGEALVDDEGEPVTKMMPIIDEEFGEALFDTSGMPGDKKLRKRFEAKKIPYNPDGENREKLKYPDVAELIKSDWEFPDYEVQRPAGAYIVDTRPVNTMVLAMTRAGKGQTYIEPMIDIWSREKRPSNMVINDPKGELLVKNYVRFTRRGFEVVQFNLINAMKTDIYNPLGLAAEAARAGDSTKCAQYVENIADVFFPVDGGEDPVWPNAANNAFKRAAYGLIDFYLEEERALRERASSTGMAPEVLQQELDDMWGKVTLYNCYQLFVQLTSKKLRNPEVELKKRSESGEFNDDPNGYDLARDEALAKSFLWEGKPESDMLTLYFNATEALPTNTVRTLINNANNALRAMAGAEKMLASVYGIAITAMSFFTDPTISTLTSGKPSQNVDLGGFSFPRRMGVRFAADYVKRDNLMGLQVVWSAYGDPAFTQNLGKEFEHTDTLGREGWAEYYFEGIFPEAQAWLKLELRNAQSGMLVRTFYFHFKKSYALSLSGRRYIVEPVTGKKIIKGGVLRELRKVEGKDGMVRYPTGSTTYPHTRLIYDNVNKVFEKVETNSQAIISVNVRYTESPKVVFLVTPPHLMKYAKLLLILMTQLVNLNFDKSYMTKSNQKPLYRTRFMLDELGNLQSDGHGIAGFETMLSIGLGQEQQFTLILQTLAQLTSVYGESVDSIVQGNTNNIIFLKSTDDKMIETLEKMSGKRHVSYIDSKQISQDTEKLIGGRTEGRVSYTMSTREEPVISYNDFAFLPPRNSIVFSAGDSPIWNRNETILPMSWRLFKDTITHPGHEYSLQTIPTLSSAMEFDVRSNQPDFTEMLDKRMSQAVWAEQAKESYKEAYEYEDIDIERLDPDVYANEIMEIITTMLEPVKVDDRGHLVMAEEASHVTGMYADDESAIDNVEAIQQAQEYKAKQEALDRKIYAEGTISRSMLINPDGSAKVKVLDMQISEAYRLARAELEADSAFFSVGGDGSLRSKDGSKTYLVPTHSDSYREAAEKLNAGMVDENTSVYGEEEVDAETLASVSTLRVEAAFYVFLAGLETWEVLGQGEFDRVMAAEMRREDD